jgi:PD-(D/E)XK endonuclease
MANPNLRQDLFGFEVDQVEPLELRNGTSNESQQGRYAEFMVCAYLTKLGYFVIHVDARGFDLVLEAEGQSFRVQVKSTSRVYAGPFKQVVEWRLSRHVRNEDRTRHTRIISPFDADIAALFFCPTETVHYIPILKSKRGTRVPISFMRNCGMGETSLKNAIAQKQQQMDGPLIPGILRTERRT